MVFLSFAIPTRDRVDLLRQAVDSVVMQDRPDCDVVIVDDASTDGTADYLLGLDRPDVRVYFNPEPIGIAANYNRAIGLTRGRFVHLLQDDDLAERELVRTISEATRVFPEAEVICFATCLVDDDLSNPQIFWQPEQARLLRPPDAFLRFAADWRISSTQVVFRRDVFERLGGMDESFPFGSDAEYILRWMLSCNVLLLPQALARRRIWPGSGSAATEPTQAMSTSMEMLVASVYSRACDTGQLDVGQLEALARSLSASFLVPYRGAWPL